MSFQALCTCVVGDLDFDHHDTCFDPLGAAASQGRALWAGAARLKSQHYTVFSLPDLVAMRLPAATHPRINNLRQTQSALWAVALSPQHNTWPPARRPNHHSQAWVWTFCNVSPRSEHCRCSSTALKPASLTRQHAPNQHACCTVSQRGADALGRIPAGLAQQQAERC